VAMCVPAPGSRSLRRSQEWRNSPAEMTPDPSRSKKRNTAERRGGVGERMRKIMRWGGGECGRRGEGADNEAAAAEVTGRR